MSGIRLRVVTINLWGVASPLELRMNLLARRLGELDPDVILMQEVRVEDSGFHQAKEITTLLGPDWRFQYAPAVRGREGTWGVGTPGGEEGLAIVSRQPIAEWKELELPEPKPTERRILLSARLAFDDGAPVWCHTTHLNWRLTDGITREKQVVAIDQELRTQHPKEALHIVGGDFNAAPDTDEIRFLTGRHTLEGRRTHYQDAYARAGSHRGPGWTWAKGNTHTEKLAWLERDRRIDYIFVSTERPDGRGRILDARVVLNQPDEAGVFASDHYGVMTDLQLRPLPPLLV